MSLRCRDFGALHCVNCERCLFERCCTTRHVIVVFSDPLPHQVEGERIPSGFVTNAGRLLKLS